MARRYGLLRMLCMVGKVASTLALAFGVVFLFVRGSDGPTAVYGPLSLIAAALGSYISCEIALVIVAIESHTRAAAIMLRNQARRDRLTLDEEESDEELDYEPD